MSLWTDNDLLKLDFDATEAGCCLNLELYMKVCKALGPISGRDASPVKIVNNLESAVIRYKPSTRFVGREDFEICDWGELYLADCPYCGDKRRRLSISHLYGTYDHNSMTHNRHLWRCFNDECQGKINNREDLYLRLEGVTGLVDLKVTPPKPNIETVRDREPKEFPGDRIELLSLPSDHVAIQYLNSRKFDVRYLSKTWDVFVANLMPDDSLWVNGRIIAPVTYQGKYVGFQARYPGDLPKEKLKKNPKYLTYFSKSKYLYGLDQASDQRVIAVFEGFTDAWRYGLGGVASLGKTLSGKQCDLVTKHFNNRNVVFVPDMDEDNYESTFNEAKETEELLVSRGFSGKVSVCRLPVGKDPADLDQTSLRNMVYNAAFRD